MGYIDFLVWDDCEGFVFWYFDWVVVVCWDEMYVFRGCVVWGKVYGNRCGVNCDLVILKSWVEFDELFVGLCCLCIGNVCVCDFLCYGGCVIVDGYWKGCFEGVDVCCGFCFVKGCIKISYCGFFYVK